MTLAAPTAYIDPATGNVIYPKPSPGGGVCYTPRNAKPKCAFHHYSKPGKGALPSRCAHPTMGRPLDRKIISNMVSCPVYEPDPLNAAAIQATTVRRSGVPTGDDIKDQDILIQLKRTKKAMDVAPGSDKSTKADFLAQLQVEDEIRIGGVLLSKYDQASLTDYTKMLVPKLKFTYRDNITPEQGSVLEFVARAAEENEIALLIGHLGSGKTTAVMKVAELVGAPLAVTNCDGQLTVEQIIGTRVPDKDASGAAYLRWQDAPLLRAYREGHWACIDDFTFTGSDVFSAIFGLMTNDYYQVLVTGEVIPKHPDFRLFLTTNPTEYVELYPNRQQPDAAFLSRIPSRIWVNYLDEVSERQAMVEAAPLLPANMLDRIQRVIKLSREYLTRQDINFAMSTRHAVNWAKKASRHQDLKRAAMEAFVADMDVESRNVMLSKILDSQLD